MENQDITNIKFLITIGILITLFLAAVIVLFVVYYQRKMLIKEAQMKLMEQEKQIELFKASVEAEEKQKEKIARNLHDEINPLLTVLKFNLSKHRIEIQKNKFEPASLVKDEETLDKAIEGIRTTCHDLVPSFLLQYGLIPSLEEYINHVQQIDGMEASFEYSSTPEDIEKFTVQEQLNIYRICLEILNNLFKHAKCSQFNMTVNTIQDNLMIEFKHNGQGVSNDEMEHFTNQSKGLGLKSLKARALILNASINYIKQPTYSTVQLNIPFKS